MSVGTAIHHIKNLVAARFPNARYGALPIDTANLGKFMTLPPDLGLSPLTGQGRAVWWINQRIGEAPNAGALRQADDYQLERVKSAASLAD
jgi:hypothetical protein